MATIPWLGAKKNPPKIFISYRRSGEGAGYGGRIADKLVEYFGLNQCFRDVKDIGSGVDFVDAINEALESCQVLVVVIGPDWLHMKDERGRRRLENENDFVRIEIASALNRNVRVIPVLVGGATVPEAEELPEDLRTLSRRQVLELTDSRWDYDAIRLIEAIESIGIKGRAPLERAAYLHRIKVGGAVVLTGALFIAGISLWPKIFPRVNEGGSMPLMSDIQSAMAAREDSLQRELAETQREVEEAKEEARQAEEERLRRQLEEAEQRAEQAEREEKERSRRITGLRGTVSVEWFFQGYPYIAKLQMRGSKGVANIVYGTPYGTSSVRYNLLLEKAPSNDASHDFHLVGSNSTVYTYSPDNFGLVENYDGDLEIVDSCDSRYQCGFLSNVSGSFRVERD